MGWSLPASENGTSRTARDTTTCVIVHIVWFEKPNSLCSSDCWTARVGKKCSRRLAQHQGFERQKSFVCRVIFGDHFQSGKEERGMCEISLNFLCSEGPVEHLDELTSLALGGVSTTETPVSCLSWSYFMRWLLLPWEVREVCPHQTAVLHGLYSALCVLNSCPTALGMALATWPTPSCSCSPFLPAFPNTLVSFFSTTSSIIAIRLGFQTRDKLLEMVKTNRESKQALSSASRGVDIEKQNKDSPNPWGGRETGWHFRTLGPGDIR